MYAAWKSTESRRPVTSVCYTIHAGTLLTFCDLHPQSMPAHVEAQVRDDGIDPLHPELGDHVIEAASGSGRGKDG